MTRYLLCILLLTVTCARGLAAQESCEKEYAAPHLPNADLYCIDLVPKPDLLGASGTVKLGRAQSPFGAVVTADGHQRYDLEVSVAGLPEPAALGDFTTYVAWATTPLLRPMIKLGEVGHGRTASGQVALDKFLVLISAEASGAVEERTGPLVLRGISASMRMMPHVGEPLWFMAPPASTDHSGHMSMADSAGWVMPPMHPIVPMPRSMNGIMPSVEPFLPTPEGPVPAARPREVIELGDGATLDLTAGPVQRTINGDTFTMYGFNGQYPGPLIKVPQDATIVVRFRNETELPTAVHWHGVRLDNRFDGVPHVTQEPVPPGGTFTYRIHFPDAGIYWYHPHHREDITQDLGLYGNIRVRSPEPDYYSSVNQEEVLMLDDLLIGESGLVPYGKESATHALMGRFGNLLLVNGEPEYDLEVKRGAVVRFFLTNVANTRTFNVSFGGAAIKVVGSDLSRFEHEEWVESVVIAPAERYIIEVRFDEPGEVAFVNRIRSIDHVYGSFFPETDTLGLIRVAATPVEVDYSDAFERLRSNEDVQADIGRYRKHFDSPVDHSLVLTVEVDGLPFPIEPMMRADSVYFNPVEWSGTMPMMNWISTGKEVNWILREPATGRENMEIDWRFQVGDVVKIRLTNDRNAFHSMQHPIHFHGQRFLILSQNGVTNDNLVWKDTMLLPAGATADVLLELSNPGDWMLHCHIAEHLEAGMKMVFHVAPN
ncbi:MAG TPA: multicopper oxidase family protein [Longimicrobiaceae bacterium]|nr:multicopper oxidase family protein [Longimicrobiaceae bacterium]